MNRLENMNEIYRRIVGTTNYHEFLPFSTDDWAKSQGATHTLITIDGDRPARLLKTVAYIGVDEDEFGNCVWEKWQLTPSTNPFN